MLLNHVVFGCVSTFWRTSYFHLQVSRYYGRIHRISHKSGVVGEQCYFEKYRKIQWENFLKIHVLLVSYVGIFTSDELLWHCTLYIIRSTKLQ